ncbi:ribose 5-phosphate isomerase B [Melioribacter sp. OK-6-Me]|uniref:ribose 5-phosphate isomerase B n=1 Tax=unclassified Melioribacter TaxID=2627329 RepID=UPI003EDAEB02
MKQLITEKVILDLIKSGKNSLYVHESSLITPAARDLILQKKIEIISSQNHTTSDKKSFEKIAIGSDHTGVKVKKLLVEYLKNKYSIEDVGTFSDEAVDYPDIALKVANKVKSGEADCGILIDATGIPSAITANKIPGIRAATCYNEFSARSSREHNNANIIAVGASSLGEETIKSIINVWLETEFLGERHQRRLDKITAIENSILKK